MSCNVGGLTDYVKPLAPSHPRPWTKDRSAGAGTALLLTTARYSDDSFAGHRLRTRPLEA